MKTSIIAATVAVFSLTSASQAAVIFTDTFDSGTGAWFKAGTENTLGNSSGQLSWSGGTTGTTDAIRQVIGRAMAAQTLTVGQTIRLSFDVTQTVETSSPGNILRVGLYNVANPPTADAWSTSGALVGAYSGYTSFVRDSAVDQQAREETGTDTNATSTGPTIAGTNITTSGNGQSFNIVLNTQYQAVFDVTLTSFTQVNTLLTLSNGYSVAGQTSVVNNGFDMVVLRSIAPVLFDNIQVSVIPEPSTALLGGLGMLALLRRRR